MYWNVEQKCRRFAKMMGTFVVLEQTSFIMAVMFSIYCVYIGNFDTSTYYLPLREKPPFNTESLLGWYMFLAIQLCMSFAYVFGVVPAISYFVCNCFYLSTLCDHFDYLIALVDVELKPSDRMAIHKNALNAHKLLSNAIDHHNKIYE